MKSFACPMADSYHPDEVESSWDKWWCSQGLFKPQSDDVEQCPSSSALPPFVVVIPPPNVTGSLHLGHALTCAIEDAIVRYHRMRGERDVLWLPGTDHAGIATQVVVEKKLMKERQLTRHDLGRDAFIEEVWKWKEANGSRINLQIRRLGASVDWSREAFTMDQNLTRAVQTAFLTLHERGLIYRANRLVNWSCALRTAISSIEVEYVELIGPTLIKVPNYENAVEFGVIHSFAYKLLDSQEEIVVATTRIETMLGDVAVAVHPHDPRYLHMHGRMLRHPFLSTRELKIICDPTLVDMNFGTGAVKVTPAHDPNDFACGQRHHLPMINIFSDDGVVNENGGSFQGQPRFVAREQIIAALTEAGLYRGHSANPMSLGVCSRSKDIVEPVLRPQWWVSCESMAKKAADHVREGKLTILPASFDKVWYSWLDNIQDWCISRQLWWGHRVPAYYVTVPSLAEFETHSMNENDFWVCGRSQEEALAAACCKWPHIDRGEFRLRQDEDVLDTWFSSGLFPFSTMGWPGQTSDLAKFYPGTLLETGHDILFFWVARMVMMGLELTGRLPFTTVYLHAMVRDKLGRKMSKSLGNVVDPIDVIQGISLEALHAKLLIGNLDPAEVARAKEVQARDFPDGIAECGADALRFGLLAYTTQGRDINLDVQRVVAYRQFGNKLWQATRFALLNFDPDFVKPASLSVVRPQVEEHGFVGDRWILSRLATAVQRVNAAFDAYEFADATTACYNFWLYDLCDVYLELIKPIVKSAAVATDALAAKQRATSLSVLYLCFNTALRLLHPFMPFITEELYHRLPQAMDTADKVAGTGGRLRCGSIMVEPYPRCEDFLSIVDPDIEQLMGTLQNISASVRQTRANVGLKSAKVELYALCSSDSLASTLNEHARDIATMAGALSVVAITASQRSTIPAGCSSSVLNMDIELYVPLAGLVDFSAELIKMEKNRDSLSASIEQQKSKMNEPGFNKMKPELKEKASTKLQSDESEYYKLSQSIDSFYQLMGDQDRVNYREQKKKTLQTESERIHASMAKFLPVGESEDKLNKKVASKYAELKSDLKRVQKQMDELTLSQN